jgi:uncharacterized protein with ATP-grasp and redox domains
MSIPLDTQCLQCHFNKNVELARSLGDEATALAFAKELMQTYLDAPAHYCSVMLGPATAALLKKYYNLDSDRFRQEKMDSNHFVLARMDEIRARVEAAEDPVLAALQFSILGNYIDFSALNEEVSFEKLDNMLINALKMELDKACYDSLCAELEQGKNLLYLTDNAGEIGFDRILAEEIHKRYPHLNITFCVRGGYANNDATREDAQIVGIPFPVIDNGAALAGTELTMLGAEAKEAMDTADVILAKGQGNAETLMDCGYNIYYALLVKCPRFIDRCQKPKLTPMLMKERK